MIENTVNVNRKVSSRVLLAGDIGGTKTLLGLFEPESFRPRPLVVRSFTTLDFPDLPAVISAFASDERVTGTAVDAACFGVAGPVLGQTASLTNVPWRIDAAAVAAAFAIPRVALLNDLQAMAYAVPVLQDVEVHVLQAGQADPTGNIALIAAGTGLGSALLHRVEGVGLVPSPAEGGHADYAARTEREIEVLRLVTRRHGRAEVEKVVSGRGLVNIHRVTHAVPCTAVEVDDLSEGDSTLPAAIATAALERRCRGCMDALEMFVDAYGAETGNWALRTVATGGVFVGGGIAPKILPALVSGRFIRAFLDKAPFEELLSRMPVKVILNDDAGLLGAAAYAQQTLELRGTN
jgi:glucokinase